MRHKRYSRVRLAAADGTTTTYLVRSVQGRLEEVPFDVCVLISRRHPRDKRPKYFFCTDLALSVHTVLSWYQKRWPCEVDFAYLKQSLGLADFRVQDYEAEEKWYAVVHLALVYLQWRLHEQRDQGLRSVADAIRAHRAEQDRDLLVTVCEEVLRLGAIQPVLDRFLIPASAA